MGVLIAVVVIVVLLLLLGFGLSVRIVKQYEQGVLFRLGRLRSSRAPGFQLIIPVVIGGQAPGLRWQQDGEHGMWLGAGGRPAACGDARQQGRLGGAADSAAADEERVQRAGPVLVHTNPQP